MSKTSSFELKLMNWISKWINRTRTSLLLRKRNFDFVHFVFFVCCYSLLNAFVWLNAISFRSFAISTRSVKFLSTFLLYHVFRSICNKKKTHRSRHKNHFKCNWVISQPYSTNSHNFMSFVWSTFGSKFNCLWDRWNGGESERDVEECKR